MIGSRFAPVPRVPWKLGGVAWFVSTHYGAQSGVASGSRCRLTRRADVRMEPCGAPASSVRSGGVGRAGGAEGSLQARHVGGTRAAAGNKHPDCW